ncbi:MAG: hypothetical protein MUF41_02675 [Sphingopyxis sp.]|jgi:hypothetical protein|nr:hypothetical protein [Sphingopyxis sp.]
MTNPPHHNDDRYWSILMLAGYAIGGGSALMGAVISYGLLAGQGVWYTNEARYLDWTEQAQLGAGLLVGGLLLIAATRWLHRRF